MQDVCLVLCLIAVENFIVKVMYSYFQIEVMHKEDEEEALYDHYSLMDVAYIFNWKRVGFYVTMGVKLP